MVYYIVLQVSYSTECTTDILSSNGRTALVPVATVLGFDLSYTSIWLDVTLHTNMYM